MLPLTSCVIARIRSTRTGAVGYLDAHGVPYNTLSEARVEHPVRSLDDAERAFALYSETLIRVTGRCRWTLEVSL